MPGRLAGWVSLQINTWLSTLSSLSLIICVKIIFYVGVCSKKDIFDKVSGLFEALKVFTKISCPHQSILSQGLCKVIVTAGDKKRQITWKCVYYTLCIFSIRVYIKNKHAAPGHGCSPPGVRSSPAGHFSSTEPQPCGSSAWPRHLVCTHYFTIPKHRAEKCQHDHSHQHNIAGSRKAPWGVL